MKLSNQQVDALAVEICKKNNQKIEKEKSERLKNPEVIKKAKVAFAIFSKLDDIGKKAKKIKGFKKAWAGILDDYDLEDFEDIEDEDDLEEIETELEEWIGLFLLVENLK